MRYLIVFLLTCSVATAGDLKEWLAKAGEPAPEIPMVAALDIPSPSILFFTRPNCPPCEAVKQTIVPWAEKSGWQVVRVQTPSTLSSAYEVEGTPTLVIIRNNEEVARQEGPDFPAFRRLLNKAVEDSVVVSAEATPTPLEDIQKALRLLNTGRPRNLLDPGCGDGRVLIHAATVYGWNGVGIEIDPERAEQARRNVEQAGLSKKIRIITGDSAEIDWSTLNVDVAYVYLYDTLLEELRPKLEKLDAFVSYYHRVPGMRMVENGDFYTWRKPAPVVTARRSSIPSATWSGGTYTPRNFRPCGDVRCDMCYGPGGVVPQWRSQGWR